MNDGKKGRPFKITNSFIIFLAIFRYVFSVGFRQLEGFTISLSKMFLILPSIDYSWIRMKMLKLVIGFKPLRCSKDLSLQSLNLLVIRHVELDLGRDRKYARRRRNVGIHFSVNATSCEILDTDTSRDNLYDSCKGVC